MTLIDTPWRIELLGRLQAQQGDLVLTRFRTQKTALLLARLALFPRRDHPREELADLLWPEAELETARNNLRQSLATLRRLIEPPGTPAGSILIATRTMIRLNAAGISTDVAEFDQAFGAAVRAQDETARVKLLRQAAALYQGELLPGFYDDWVLEERELLAARAGEVQSALANVAAFNAAAFSVTVDRAAEPFVPARSETAPAAPRLPLQFTRFFGRELERAEIAGLLRDPQVRLLTLSGPGGSGKTRLSLEVARQAADHYDCRVYFASLADFTDADLIFPAIADSLHLIRGSGDEPLAQVVAALSAAPALLVLDNLEQFAAAAASPVLTLLTRIPSLTILATSRHRLYVAGEQEFPVAPLPVPPASSPGTAALPEILRLLSSVQVFVDRAQTARPDFQLTVRNAEAIADVCRRLEGLPLALELAAAWAQVLTPAQMRDRLQERFTLLVSRAKDVPDRHSTLRAAIAWSNDLLAPPLAEFWRRVSVFRGGFTAEAAAEVCGEPQALDCLGQLRARSLVTLEDADDTIRFRLLESLREFGWESMAAEEQKSLASRHLTYFLQFAEAAEPHLTGPEPGIWLDRLALEQDNLRAALQGGANREGKNSEGKNSEGAAERLRLAGALWRFWAVRGPLREGCQFLAQALSDAERTAEDTATTPALARALNGLAVLTRRQGDLEAAGEIQRHCLAAWRALDDTRGIAAALNNLGTLVTMQGNFHAAEGFLTESLHLWRQLAQPLPIAQTLNNLGFLAQERGDPLAADNLCTESLALFRQHNSPQGKTLSLTILATAAVARNEMERAVPLCREALEIAEAARDTQAVVTCLQVLAEVHFAADAAASAAQLLGSAKKLRAEIGSFQDRRAQHCVAQLTRSIQKALPAEIFQSAWSEGEAMTLQEAITFALRQSLV